MFSSVSPALMAIVGLVVLLVLLVLLITSRYKVAGPNEAFIVTGRKGRSVRNVETGVLSTDLSGQKVVMGGGVFVIPFVQRLHILDLSSRRISVQIRGAVSGQGVKLNLDGVEVNALGWAQAPPPRCPPRTRPRPRTARARRPPRWGRPTRRR